MKINKWKAARTVLRSVATLSWCAASPCPFLLFIRRVARNGKASVKRS